MSMPMEKLFEIQRIILEQFERQPFYARDIFHTFYLDNKICGLVGSRGVGKTTFLLHHILKNGAKERRALYVSADNLYFLTHSLVDLVDKLYKETDVRLLCVDEIHKYPEWEQELKNITDTYFEFQIIFSGSSQIELVHGKYDLSRRVTLYLLHGFSFREYLHFHTKHHLPKYDLHQLIQSHLSIADQLGIPHILKHFRDYLRYGYYPFFDVFTQEREKFQAIENITQKTIYEDIGTLHALKTPSLNLIEKLYKFILNSAPGELSAYKLASNLGKDFETISNYLLYLEQAGLLRSIYPKKTGQAFLRNPVKIYPENTNMQYAAYLPLAEDNRTGKVRETFVINQLQNAKLSVYYSKTGDFLVDDYVFEVGGKNKTQQQIKNQNHAFILMDGILTGSIKTIPLYLLGFLY
jgi:uncharacterized protein